MAGKPKGSRMGTVGGGEDQANGEKLVPVKAGMEEGDGNEGRVEVFSVLCIPQNTWRGARPGELDQARSSGSAGLHPQGLALEQVPGDANAAGLRMVL